MDNDKFAKLQPSSKLRKQIESVDLTEFITKTFSDPNSEFIREQLEPLNKAKMIPQKYEPDMKLYEEIRKNKEEEQQSELDYRESILNSLQGIEKNTALLTEMTLLLQKSNDKQDEMFLLIVEIMEIMKSANKEEADSKFTVVTKKITAFTDTASTMQSLIGMATTVYNALPF